MPRLLLLIALSVFFAIACRRTESAVPQNTTSADVSPTKVSATIAATSAGADAQQLVADLYRRHTAGDTPFFQAESREKLEAYFEPVLAGLIWSDAVASKGEVGALSFDPLYNAQDTNITNFIVYPGVTDSSGARVVVTFNNFEKPERITYSLVRVGAEWRIADINYGETALRDILTSAAGAA